MKRVTSFDVARLAGVSRATVSAVVNGRTSPRISDETRRRVLDAIKQLNYSPDFAGRSLKTGASLSIGVIVPTIADPFIANVVQGIEDACLAPEYTVWLCNAYRDTQRTEKYVRILLQRQVDGIIVLRPPRRFAQVADIITGANVPAVYVDTYPKPWAAATVTVDSESGGYEATAHLLEWGHRRIAFLSAPLGLGSRLERFRGYKRAMKAWGVPVDRSLVWIGPREYEEKRGTYGSYELELAESWVEDDIAACATAAVTTSDMLALGLMRHLTNKGVEIPADFSIIGSDLVPHSALVRPMLTVVSQPKYRLGQEAATLLLGQIKKERKPAHILLPTRLVSGGSVGPAPN